MDRVGAPPLLWMECISHVVYMLNHMAHPRLKNRTPYEAAMGWTPDISALLHYYFYQPIYYYDKITTSFPDSKERIGWWIGVAEHTGDALTYKILTANHRILLRSVICPTEDPLTPNKQAEAVLQDGYNSSTSEEGSHLGDIITSEADVLDQERLGLPNV